MKKYPIAERFTSLQGEGLYTGTMMYFIRFAGCSVGKKMTEKERMKFEAPESPLPVYREKCTLYDGREFACDTDFRTKEVMSEEELVASIPKGVKHVCFTGGEPLNHVLTPLLEKMAELTDCYVHIETSGTVSMNDHAYPEYTWEQSMERDGGWLWLTVSPKFGILPEMIGIANEIKLLVDKDFDIKKVSEDILDHRLVWVQPVNDEWTVDKDNMQRCVNLLHEYPNWRMSSQMHKIWGVR